MKTVALEDARTTLGDLLQQVAAGEESTITQNGEPRATLAGVSVAYRKNGILVHHTGPPITSEDVTGAWSEE